MNNPCNDKKTNRAIVTPQRIGRFYKATLPALITNPAASATGAYKVSAAILYRVFDCAKTLRLVRLWRFAYFHKWEWRGFVD